MLMPERYAEHKAQVMAALRDLAGLAGDLGMRSLRVDIEAVRLPKLADERFNLVVLGEFNHGKTTFVNALLGEPLLPAGITPTTATINHIVWGETPRARAVLYDGGVAEIAPAQLSDYLTLDGSHSEQTRYVELAYPAPILRDRVTLVDTPGVNDINEARAEITYSYIPRADAVVFLLDSTQPLKRSERSFIEQRLLRRSRDKLIFVLGKADLLREDELRQVLEFTSEHLAALVPEPVLFAISPRQHLEKQTERSGMQPFLDFLRNYLEEQRTRILLDNALSDGERTAAYLQSTLGIKRASLELSLEELNQRVAEVRRRLEGSQQSLRENLGRIKASGDGIKATIRHDLHLFTESFCEALPKEIDKAEAADVKKYLQLFIQDKFKEWAEQEGDRAAQMLEHLAEEIIQITNENAHQVMEAVAAGFGPGLTKVDLEVDTLRYDAGIFVLGALGPTIFLFVNAFVGGLLTLAAPVLAVVLREKAGGRIKEQARQHAPEVVRKAAEAVQPRFETIVAEFADKLSEYVESAGETLHRGISEVLDQAVVERQGRQRDAALVSAEIQEKLERLSAVEQRLNHLRSAIWQAD
jgi:GTPase Era involved in 16S rRNA processing